MIRALTRKLYWGAFLVPFVVACLDTSSTLAEPLVWKFAEGDRHQYQMVQDMQMAMNLGIAGKVTAKVTQKLDVSWQIESIDEQGVAQLTQRITRAQMEVSAPGQVELKYDTASEEQPQGYAAMLAPTIEALRSSPVRAKMTPRGELYDIEIPDALITAMSRGSAGNMLGSLGTVEGYRSFLQQNSIVLPAEENLTEGHEWSSVVDTESKAGGRATTTTTYRYSGFREVDGRQFEVFEPTSQVEYSEPQDPEAAKIAVVGQESTGEILFDREAGRLESVQRGQQLELSVIVGGNESREELSQTITVTRMEENTESQAE